MKKGTPHSAYYSLTRCIDYAGTFAPASLPLEEALREAATQSENDRYPWLYSRMALPLAEILKLKTEALLKLNRPQFRWDFTALGGKIDPVKGLKWDFKEIAVFNQKGKNSALQKQITSYEVLYPESVDFFALEDQPTGLTDLYIELPITTYTESELALKIQSLSEVSEQSPLTFGLKFRTGGEKTPTAHQLAAAIALTREHSFKFKATQGLHEAITDAKGFGFLNLFFALHFTYYLGTEQFSALQIEQCLSDKESKHFRFEESGIGWKEFTLTLEQIEKAKQLHAGCFGSCSLKEPNESLHKFLEG